jgi:hypothetical protein
MAEARGFREDLFSEDKCIEPRGSKINPQQKTAPPRRVECRAR